MSSVTIQASPYKDPSDKDFILKIKTSLIKYDLAEKLCKPGQHIGLLASLILGAYTAYSLPWNLAGKLLGGVMMYEGSKDFLQSIATLATSPIFLSTKEGKTLVALADDQFVKFARENEMFTSDTIVKAHKLFQERKPNLAVSAA